MKTEDIQKIAKESAEKRYSKEGTEYVMAKAEAYCIGFQSGAIWRINTVWHDRTEPAKEGNDIILLFPDGKCSVITCDGDWELFITWMLLEKWAYLKDIFPDNFVKTK